METIVGSVEDVHQSPMTHRRSRRFSINSNRCNTSLINNKNDEVVIQGEASIVFHKDGRRLHGIIQAKQGGLCQIIGKLDDSDSSPEIFSYETNDEDNQDSSSRIYSTELFQNHFESQYLGPFEVLRNKDKCHISSSACKVNFTSSQVYRGVNADKLITSLLGPSFVEQGHVCYTGHIVIGFSTPPILPTLNSSKIVQCFL